MNKLLFLILFISNALCSICPLSLFESEKILTFLEQVEFYEEKIIPNKVFYTKLGSKISIFAEGHLPNFRKKIIQKVIATEDFFIEHIVKAIDEIEQKLIGEIGKSLKPIDIKVNLLGDLSDSTRFMDLQGNTISVKITDFFHFRNDEEKLKTLIRGLVAHEYGHLFISSYFSVFLTSTMNKLGQKFSKSRVALNSYSKILFQDKYFDHRGRVKRFKLKYAQSLREDFEGYLKTLFRFRMPAHGDSITYKTFRIKVGFNFLYMGVEEIFADFFTVFLMGNDRGLEVYDLMLKSSDKRSFDKKEEYSFKDSVHVLFQELRNEVWKENLKSGRTQTLKKLLAFMNTIYLENSPVNEELYKEFVKEYRKKDKKNALNIIRELDQSLSLKFSEA